MRITKITQLPLSLGLSISIVLQFCMDRAEGELLGYTLDSLEIKSMPKTQHTSRNTEQ